MKTNLTNEYLTNGADEPVITVDQLREAFYHVEEIMERSLIPYYVIGDTGKSLIEVNELAGGKIEIGVRQADYTAGAKSTMDTLRNGGVVQLGMDNFEYTAKGFKWTFKDVPIVVSLIKRNYEFLKNPTFVYYNGECYNIPNPFNKYYQVRGVVQ